MPIHYIERLATPPLLPYQDIILTILDWGKGLPLVNVGGCSQSIFIYTTSSIALIATVTPQQGSGSGWTWIGDA
ncbi:hypothetical protein, partial [Chryseobacterium aurantiacum]|uniref:hypothetical protein n=1 Tax=Chryseobacterium aurantiacum TaxID=2116499 RepID=UPI0013C3E9E6